MLTHEDLKSASCSIRIKRGVDMGQCCRGQIYYQVHICEPRAYNFGGNPRRDLRLEESTHLRVIVKMTLALLRGACMTIVPNGVPVCLSLFAGGLYLYVVLMSFFALGRLVIF